MNTAIPTLSINGWTTDKKSMVAKLFEHFLCSNNSQTSVYLNTISSFKYIIKNSDDDIEIRKELTNSLNMLYKCYFESVVVNVYSSQDAENPAITNYAVDIVCKDELGNEYKLSKEISESNKQILNFETEIEELKNLS